MNHQWWQRYQLIMLKQHKMITITIMTKSFLQSHIVWLRNISIATNIINVNNNSLRQGKVEKLVKDCIRSYYYPQTTWNSLCLALLSYSIYIISISFPFGFLFPFFPFPFFLNPVKHGLLWKINKSNYIWIFISLWEIGQTVMDIKDITFSPASTFYISNNIEKIFLLYLFTRGGGWWGGGEDLVKFVFYL